MALARHWSDWYLPELVSTLVCPFVIVLLCLPLRAWISPTDVAMLQLLWVAWQAQHHGWRWAAMTTLISVLLLNWYFVPPYHTFDVHDASFFISFVVMVLLGLLISVLSDRSKQQLKRLRNAMSQSRGMYMLAKGLSHRTSWPDQCAYTAKLLSRRIKGPVQILDVKPQTISPDLKLVPIAVPAIAWIQTPAKALSSHATLIQAAQSLLTQSYTRIQLSEKAQQDRVYAQLEQQKTMLLRSLSHDLRTPLATIMGASSMLADPQVVLTEQQRQQQASNIFQQSQILNQHFEKVLELSKAQLSNHILVRCEFSSDDLIAGALARRGDDAPLLSHQLRVSSACPLHGDAELLEIALANMLENALRHGLPPFELSCQLMHQRYVLQLCNKPSGKTSKTRDKGHGLGLNICQTVANLHQGQFSLHADRQLVTARLEWPL